MLEQTSQNNEPHQVPQSPFFWWIRATCTRHWCIQKAPTSPTERTKSQFSTLDCHWMFLFMQLSKFFAAVFTYDNFSDIMPNTCLGSGKHLITNWYPRSGSLFWSCPSFLKLMNKFCSLTSALAGMSSVFIICSVCTTPSGVLWPTKSLGTPVNLFSIHQSFRVYLKHKKRIQLIGMDHV